MRKVICVVEDEKTINDLMSQYLKEEGYEVRSYYTHEEASAYVMDDDVHSWVLGIMLDDESGSDLIEKIRPQGRDIPVTFMPARNREFDRVIGLEKRSGDYITKPFPPKELVLHVNNVIKCIYRGDSSRIMMDGYELGKKRCKVLDHGVEIDLTTREFDLLMLFIKNKGAAFSRDKILVSVWEESYFGSDHVVGNTLRRLHKKLPGLNVHTIYGCGYRLG